MGYAIVDDDVIQHYRDNARQEAKRLIHELVDRAGLPPFTCSTVVVHGDPTLRITEQEKVQAADLIVMGKHGESALEELLLGSVTKYVLAAPPCDILVSPMRDEHRQQAA